MAGWLIPTGIRICGAFSAVLGESSGIGTLAQISRIARDIVLVPVALFVAAWISQTKTDFYRLNLLPTKGAELLKALGISVVGLLMLLGLVFAAAVPVRCTMTMTA